MLKKAIFRVWLIPRGAAGDVVAVREGKNAGPLQSVPGVAADDPSMALSRLLAKLTDRDPAIRAAAIEGLGDSHGVEAVAALRQLLMEADGPETAAYALAWIIRGR